MAISAEYIKETTSCDEVHAVTTSVYPVEVFSVYLVLAWVFLCFKLLTFQTVEQEVKRREIL